MGLPSVIINFKETAPSAIKRGERGVEALVLKDSVEEIEQHDILSISDIHSDLKEFNREQIELALIGYQTAPRKRI